MRRSVQPVVAFVLLALAGCTVRRGADPFSGDLSGRATNGPAVRVTLEVVCDACVISYSVGATSGSARQDRLNPVWTTSLVRNPMSSETARLTATSDGGSVRRVRIFVDGEIAAVDDNDITWSRTMWCTTARIPRTDSDAPVRGGWSESNGHTNEGAPRSEHDSADSCARCCIDGKCWLTKVCC
jgi:hypothetical protein